MRKIYILPNLVTTANLYCGFTSIAASIQGNFQVAAWLILAAGVFDALDGRIARLAKATSEFGVQYDSMADLVSFGVAPGILLYQQSLEPLGRYGTIAAFFYVCCAALRLARFNVNTTVVSKKFFQGISSPIAASNVGTLVIFQNATGWPTEDSVFGLQVINLIQAIALGALMVSSVPFPSFKELNWRKRASFGILMIGVLTLIFIAIKPEVTLFIGNSAYIVISFVWATFMIATGRLDLKSAPKSEVNSLILPAQTALPEGRHE